VGRVSQPKGEVCARSCADDPANVGDEALGSGNRRARLAKRLTVGTFVRVAVFHRTEQYPMGLARRETALAWRRAEIVVGLSAAASPPWSAWSRAPSAHVLTHRRRRAGEALRLDLQQQGGAVPLALRPRSPQGGGLRIADVRPTAACGA
jgi:hypothetical protein